MSTPANPDDLTAWLRAQLADDERMARASADEGDGHWRLADYQDGTTTAWHGEVEVMTSLARADAEHIARHDPARVLAEVDAKRRILDLHPHQRFAALPEEWPDHWKAEIKQAFPGSEQPYVGCEVDDFNSDYEVVEPGWWCQTVRLLALPFAARDGYRSEWAPA